MIDPRTLIGLISGEVKRVAKSKQELARIYTAVQSACRSDEDLCRSIAVIASVVRAAAEDSMR